MPPPDLETGPETRCRRRPPHPEIAIAWIVLVAGILAMAANMGIISTALWRLWPLAIVAAGLVQYAKGGHADRVWGGAIMIYGAGATLTTTHVWSYDFWQAWPIFIIAAGLVMMDSRRDWESWRRWSRQWGYQPPSGQSAGQSGPTAGPAPSGSAGFWAGPAAGGAETHPGDDSWLDVETLFGSVRRQIKNQSFRGGIVKCIFSGCIIDLRAMPVPDHAISIHAEAIFGGIEIYLPPNWQVILEGHGVFGAFQDETLPIGPVGGPRPVLVVTGAAVFGAVQVK